MIWMIVNHLCGCWVCKTCNKVPMYRCTGRSGDIAWANRVLQNTTPLQIAHKLFLIASCEKVFDIKEAQSRMCVPV
jgi:hypothetical protein